MLAALEIRSCTGNEEINSNVALFQVLITTHDGKPALNKKINVNEHSNGKKIMEIERIAKNGVLEFEVEPPSDATTISLRVSLNKLIFHQCWVQG